MAMPIERHFYFDLYHRPEGNYHLRSCGESVPLVTVDNHLFCSSDPDAAALERVPVAAVTHTTAVAAKVPADRLHLMRVFHTPAGAAIPELVLVGIHVPPKYLNAHMAGRGGALASHLGMKAQHLSMGSTTDLAAVPLASALQAHISAYDTAATLIYQHPELFMIGAEHAPAVLDSIAGDPRSGQKPLAMLTYVVQNTPWNTIKPVLDDQGQPRHFPGSGKPIFEYDLSQTTLNTMREPLQNALIASKQSLHLQDVTWHRVEGISTISLRNGQASTGHLMTGRDGTAQDVTGQNSTPPGRQSAVESLGASAAAVQYQVAQKEPKSGFAVELLESKATSVKLKFTNSYVRWLSIYAQYYSDGKVLKLPTDFAYRELAEDHLDVWLDDADVVKHGPPYTNTPLFGSDTLKYLHRMSSEAVVLGIPVAAALHIMELDLPPGVTVDRIRILGGGIGQIAGLDSDEALAWYIGFAFTGFFNFALPTYAICSTAGASDTKTLKQVFSDKTFLASMAYYSYSAVVAFEALVKGQDNAGESLRSALLGLGTTLVSTVLSNPVVMVKLAAYFGAEEAEEAIPIVGWIGKAALVSAAVSQLTQTITEVVSSPALIPFDIGVSMSASITLNKPSNNPTGFPATATKLVLTYAYSDKTTHRDTIDLSAQDLLQATFSHTSTGLPVGGKVSLTAGLYSDENWLVGRACSSMVDNAPGLRLTLTIEQLEYPLTTATRYLHHRKLAYGPDYHWVAQATGPGATAAALSHQLGRHNLSFLNGICFNGAQGALGYSWQASGLNLPDADTGQMSPGEQLFAMQSIFSGSPPAAGLMSVPAAFRQAPKLIYLRSSQTTQGLPPAPRPGDGNLLFFLDPRTDAGGGRHLRRISVVVDTAVPADDPRRLFDIDGTTSWGLFPFAPDDLAIHTTGFVAGISSEFSQLAVLRLPQSAQPEKTAPVALPVSGPGLRAGLVQNPVAVATAPDGRILVLEGGSMQVQAFDVSGNPVTCFGPAAGRSHRFALHNDAPAGTTHTFTGMSVEAMGYVYISGFTGRGYAMSDFFLDVYTPDGSLLSRSDGLAAGATTTDLWRDVYTVNFETLAGPGGRTEPSVSVWRPHTPHN